MEHSPHSMAFTDPLSLQGAEKRTALQTIAGVLPYLWPQHQPTMRARVVVALGCLLLGRMANVYGPVILKDLIDMLQQVTEQGIAPTAAFQGLLVLALMYGASVILPGIFTEIRAAVFIPVSEFAQRTIALKAFSHLHNLGMRFHLDRKTGGLSRAIERGTRALQQTTGLFAFNIAPTLFEIVLVCTYLGLAYHFKYVLVILLSVAAYIGFTLLYTEWRTKY
ncbi:MAG: hypothetical protein KDI36_15730, partial [Pseudomonadales bacterium]|nr:hypothetical protein [Pseudomonadales bacterium]